MANYLYTVTFKTSTRFYKNTLPAGVIITNVDVSTSDDKFEKLTREFNIHYRSCIGSLIYLLSTRVDLRFLAHKLEYCSSNPGKIYF